MVRMRRIRLADHRGRDATVLLVPIVHSEHRRHRDMEGRPVVPARRVRATQETSAGSLLARWPDPEELVRALISEDPELDLETTGRSTGPCDRVYLDGEGCVLYAPSMVEVRYGPDGLEAERRPLSVRPSNLVTPVPPVWSGVMLPKEEVIRNHALTRAYQVMHTNALEFDFLHGIAAHLDARGAMVQVGSGRRGTGPLIPERNGTPHRGFLDGRVQGDAMRLVLYLAAYGLKEPETRHG